MKILHHIFITFISKSNHFMPHITESLYSWCWKGSLEATCSKPHAQARPPKGICSAPCPGRLWRPPRRNTPQPLWQPVPVFGHPHSEKVYLDVQRKLPVFVCAHCLYSTASSLFPLREHYFGFWWEFIHFCSCKTWRSFKRDLYCFLLGQFLTNFPFV